LLSVLGPPLQDAVAPSISLSGISIGRDSTSKLTFDVTATIDGVQGSGRPCPSSSYTCTATLYAQTETGGTVLLQSVTIPWGITFPAPSHFSGTFDVAKVVGVEVYVYGNGAGVYSGWTGVTDPLANLPRLTTLRMTSRRLYRPSVAEIKARIGDN
jgi:hypothetical protein